MNKQENRCLIIALLGNDANARRSAAHHVESLRGHSLNTFVLHLLGEIHPFKVDPDGWLQLSAHDRSVFIELGLSCVTWIEEIFRWFNTNENTKQKAASILDLLYGQYAKDASLCRAIRKVSSDLLGEYSSKNQCAGARLLQRIDMDVGKAAYELAKALKDCKKIGYSLRSSWDSPAAQAMRRIGKFRDRASYVLPLVDRIFLSGSYYGSSIWNACCDSLLAIGDNSIPYLLSHLDSTDDIVENYANTCGM